MVFEGSHRWGIPQSVALGASQADQRRLCEPHRCCHDRAPAQCSVKTCQAAVHEGQQRCQKVNGRVVRRLRSSECAIKTHGRKCLLPWDRIGVRLARFQREPPAPVEVDRARMASGSLRRDARLGQGIKNQIGRFDDPLITWSQIGFKRFAGQILQTRNVTHRNFIALLG